MEPQRSQRKTLSPQKDQIKRQIHGKSENELLIEDMERRSANFFNALEINGFSVSSVVGF
jgi:hypothetical protein